MDSTLAKIVRRGCAAWRPPRFMPLSEWAEAFAYLSPESSAVVGKFHGLAYQKGIFDAFTDRSVERLTLMKSARVGGTKMINFAIAYRIDQNPRSMLVVHPTIQDAKKYSKSELAPMFRDTPVLWGKVSAGKSRDSGNTIQQKEFVGGAIYLVGANSPSGLSGITVGDVFLDEVDRYNSEAGNEGSPVDLAIRRTATFPNRKIVINSSPSTRGSSQVDPEFLKGDQRRYYVPCPHCGTMKTLQFRAESGREAGFTMEWPEEDPDAAFFRCPECRAEIGEDRKIWMIEHGEWRASQPFRGHASFHIWTAYSYSVNDSWGNIAREFVASKGAPERLKVFVNTWLGETWTSQGDAPDWHRLYERRESYPRNVVPERARAITAAADVHKDRVEVELIAWAPGMESWGLDHRIFYGNTDTLDSPVWRDLDMLLVEEFRSETGKTFKIAVFGIDCGYNTQVVTTWASRQAFPRVIAVKGEDRERRIIGNPSFGETTLNGRRIASSVRHYPIGVSLIKSELYGWLRQPAPTEETPAIPIGYCHFSVNVHDAEYFRQLTAERFEVKETRSGRKKYEWVKDYKRNEILDLRVYNRALAYFIGVDRLKPSAPASPSGGGPETARHPPPDDPRPAAPARRSRSQDRRPRRLW